MEKCILPRENPQPPDTGRTLPEDVWLEILVKLPSKYLLRMKCVCKSWYTLITDVSFILRHYRRHYSLCKADGDIPLILVERRIIRSKTPRAEDLQVYLLSKQQSDDVVLNLSPDLALDMANNNLPVPSRSGSCVGVANGVICWLWRGVGLGLWNPATREFKAVPPWLNQAKEPKYKVHSHFRVGFGFDHVSNDFKIVMGTRSCRGEPPVFEIFSVAANSWKRLKDPQFTALRTQSTFANAYINGVCYWLADSICDEGDPVLLSFNLCTEVFKVSDLPQFDITERVELGDFWTVGVYKESLAFFVTRIDLDKAEYSFDIWVVTGFLNGDLGIAVSWQHIFTIGPLLAPKGLILEAVRLNGDMLFHTNYDWVDGRICLYNSPTSTLKDLGLANCIRPGYNESLFPLSKRLV